MRRVTRGGKRSHGRFREGEIGKDRDRIHGLGAGKGRGHEEVMQVTGREFRLEFSRDLGRRPVEFKGRRCGEIWQCEGRKLTERRRESAGSEVSVVWATMRIRIGLGRRDAGSRKRGIRQVTGIWQAAESRERVQS